jgi:hypothetical protein
MSSNTIPDQLEKQPSRPQPPEWAPSQMRAEEPQFIRLIGTIGLFLLVFGGTILILRATGRTNFLVRLWLGCLTFELGMVGMLFHAAGDPDPQIRRAYGFFGLAWLALGVLFCLIPVKDVVGGLFGYGFLFMLLALLFLLACLRYERESAWRDRLVAVIGIAGAAMAVIAFVGSNIPTWDFLLPQGVLLALLGLGYLWSFVSLRGTSDPVGYRAGLAFGTLGLLVFLIALGRSALPSVFHSWHWITTEPVPYLKPHGFLLMCLGGFYAVVAAILCSDNHILVLTRREFVAFFYSPIAYIVLVGLTVVASFFFVDFVANLVPSPRNPMFEMYSIEPIVRSYMLGWIPVFCLIIVVPLLTMRLLSEEQRTGTMEVLLTAPVNETEVVLSKFLASLVFFLLTWAPWVLLLAAFRLEVGQPFDYRPLVSFFIAMAFMGAGFLSMGLFFSSLTRSQIASAILTVVGMLLFLGIFFAKRQVERDSPTGPWAVVLGHVSFIDLWIDSLGGSLAPHILLFYLSLSIFWLFLTVKVLEIRRWS